MFSLGKCNSTKNNFNNRFNRLVFLVLDVKIKSTNCAHPHILFKSVYGGASSHSLESQYTGLDTAI